MAGAILDAQGFVIIAFPIELKIWSQLYDKLCVAQVTRDEWLAQCEAFGSRGPDEDNPLWLNFYRFESAPRGLLARLHLMFRRLLSKNNR